MTIARCDGAYYAVHAGMTAKTQSPTPLKRPLYSLTAGQLSR